MDVTNKTAVINTNTGISRASSSTTIINRIYGRSTVSAKDGENKIMKSGNRTHNEK